MYCDVRNVLFCKAVLTLNIVKYINQHFFFILLLSYSCGKYSTYTYHGAEMHHQKHQLHNKHLINLAVQHKKLYMFIIFLLNVTRKKIISQQLFCLQHFTSHSPTTDLHLGKELWLHDCAIEMFRLT